jgi:hypothetical protein
MLSQYSKRLYPIVMMSLYNFDLFKNILEMRLLKEVKKIRRKHGMVAGYLYEKLCRKILTYFNYDNAE